ncbi:hypothetical protein Mycch_4961 [Mycolicibacterium chubuense NBB4]|uniref:Uncharacterized protein n=1 Tax=Mycolicibacterium chubuense (strain NBB4) TaxID=710421 RepID=I4BQU3_MYCCN|nr:hypothetical protein [Mycolicibacterium chubuense]AFM19650.1 hypothetical protein Mycch_4961 [Mycolicibacterium chubuense NBB4]
MRTHRRAATAAVVGLGITLSLITACQRTTEGMVAQTTEPGPPLTSEPTTSGRSPGIPGLPGIPGITIPNLPLPTRGTNVPEVPAPPNATTMSCEEYNKLDEATRVAVVRAILAQQNNPLGPNGESIGQILADAACQFLPSAKVSEVLMGS